MTPNLNDKQLRLLSQRLESCVPLHQGGRIFVDLKTASERIGAPLDTIRMWEDQGKFPEVIRGKGEPKVRLTDLQTWEAKIIPYGK